MKPTHSRSSTSSNKSTSQRKRTTIRSSRRKITSSLRNNPHNTDGTTTITPVNSTIDSNQQQSIPLQRSIPYGLTNSSSMLSTRAGRNLLYPLGSDQSSDASLSTTANSSDSPFTLHTNATTQTPTTIRRIGNRTRRYKNTADVGYIENNETTLATFSSQNSTPATSNGTSVANNLSNHHDYNLSTPHITTIDQDLKKQRKNQHVEQVESLHKRPYLKDIPHQLTSFKTTKRTTSSTLNTSSMNDENNQERGDDDGEDDDDEQYTDDLPPEETRAAINISTYDDTIPDPSQLTKHVPDFTPNVVNSNNGPPKAKYHPKLQEQLIEQQKQQEYDSTNLKKQQIRPRMRYTRSKLPTEIAPISHEDDDEDIINDDEEEEDINQPPPGACTIEEAMECVVKIFVTQSLPNFLQPWQKRPSTDHMGSGFVIKGKRIVTNAHVVADALVVMIRRPGSSRKHLARVVASAHECDLALLEVDDETFWGPESTSIDFEQGTIGVEAKNSKNSKNLPKNDNQHSAQNSKSIKYRKNINKQQSDSSFSDDIDGDDDDDEDVLAARHGGGITTDKPNTPDLPGVGPGSVGSPWWTSLAPDAPRRKNNKTNDLFAIKDDNVDVPLFTTTTPFVKEQGSLYVSPAMPGLQSSVVVIGYPLGGDNASITQGVVSRIEPTTYAHTGTYLLAIQIDAAINPGNSGGPALSIDGRVIGVAFQNITNASNVGYIIPAPVIIHFLRDVQRGAYRITKQTKENNRTMNRLTLFSQNQQSKINTPIVPPATTPGTDQRFFTPYLSGFPAIGLFCQETTSESLRDYIGLSSCSKLTPIDPNDNVNTPGHQQQHPGFNIIDAVAELRRYRELKNHQALDTPVQHFQRLRQYQIQAAALAAKNINNSTSNDISGYKLYQYETTNVPAAYSHYYMLEQHIKEDVRRKRQFPTIDHGVEQVGLSQHNKTLTLIHHDYEVNNQKHPLGLPLPQSKHNIVHVTQRHRKETISGVLVSEVSALSSFHKLVFPGDVLLAVDGHELGSDGSVHFRGHERIAFDHITSLKHDKQIIQLTILRRKKPQNQPPQTLEAMIGGPNSMFQVSNVSTNNNGNNNGQQNTNNLLSLNENPNDIDTNAISDSEETEDYTSYHSHHDEGIQYTDKHKSTNTKPKRSHNVVTSNTKNTPNKPNIGNADGNNSDDFSDKTDEQDKKIEKSNKMPMMKPKKLKNKTKARYRNRIVAPCDQCSNDVQIPPYNATYYQNIHEPDENDDDVEVLTTTNTDGEVNIHVKRNKMKKIKSWNTAFGIAADFIYTKQNNPVLKDIIKTNIERMKVNMFNPQNTRNSNGPNGSNGDNNNKTTLNDVKKISSDNIDTQQKQSKKPLPPPLPNSITSPAHYTRLPLNYTKLQHPGKQYPDKYKIPSTPVNHTLCIHEDFELLTIKAPVSILPTTSPNVYDRGSSYVFFGGLLFVPLSYQYTKDVGNDAPLHLTLARCAGLASHDEEKVILAQVLQDNETVGYPYLDRPISHICGVPVRNMKGLLEVIHTKSIIASVSNVVKSALLQNPNDLPLLLHMLQTNNKVDYLQNAHINIVHKGGIDNMDNNNEDDADSGGTYDDKSIPILANDANLPKNASTLIYRVTPDATERCRQAYELMCALSDILCSETDIRTYSQSLLKIYNNIPAHSSWKRYLLQVLDMYLYQNDLTPVPRVSSLAATTHDEFVRNDNYQSHNGMGSKNQNINSNYTNIFKNNDKNNNNGNNDSGNNDNNNNNKSGHNHHSDHHNGDDDDNYYDQTQFDYSPTTQVSNHIHRSHSTPTQQSILALFHHDIRKYPLESIPLPFIKQNNNNNDAVPTPPLPFSPIDFLPFKPHTMTVQTTENKLITLDMERAIGAHYRLKETLNI